MNGPKGNCKLNRKILPWKYHNIVKQIHTIVDPPSKFWVTGSFASVFRFSLTKPTTMFLEARSAIYQRWYIISVGFELQPKWVVRSSCEYWSVVIGEGSQGERYVDNKNQFSYNNYSLDWLTNLNTHRLSFVATSVPGEAICIYRVGICLR